MRSVLGLLTRAVIQPLESNGLLLDVEIRLDKGAAGSTKARDRLRVLDEVVNGVGKRRHVPLVHQQCRTPLPHAFRIARMTRRHDRRTHRLRFENNRRQALAVAVRCRDTRHDDDGRSPDPLPDPRRRQEPRELRIGADFSCQAFERGTQRPVSDQDTTHTATLRAQPAEGSQQILAAFLLDEAADEYRDGLARRNRALTSPETRSAPQEEALVLHLDGRPAGKIARTAKGLRLDLKTQNNDFLDWLQAGAQDVMEELHTRWREQLGKE